MRNAQGYRTRTTWFTAAGKASSVRTRSVHGTSVEVVSKSGAGALFSRDIQTYDAHGVLAAERAYYQDGKKFFDVSYKDGLPVRRLKIGAKHRYVTMLHYDAQRMLTSGSFSVDGKLVCRFVYQHASDGVLQRTVAYSPTHALWATYPDSYIEEIRQDGTPIFGEHATIYHKGSWW